MHRTPASDGYPLLVQVIGCLMPEHDVKNLMEVIGKLSSFFFFSNLLYKLLNRPI